MHPFSISNILHALLYHPCSRRHSHTGSHMGYDIRDRSPLPLDVTNASATSTSNVIGQLDKVLYVILEPNGSGSNKAVCSDGTYRLKVREDVVACPCLFVLKSHLLNSFPHYQSLRNFRPPIVPCLRLRHLLSDSSHFCFVH